MIQKEHADRERPVGRDVPASGATRRFLDAIATGLAAAGILGVIDAVGYYAGLGTNEWPEILSFSLILSTALYVPATVCITLLLLPFPWLRREGRLEALRLVFLFAAGLAFTNLNRALTALIFLLQSGKVNFMALRGVSGLGSPLLLVVVLLITLPVGRYGLWRLRHVWGSRRLARLVYVLAGLCVAGLLLSIVTLSRTTYRLPLPPDPTVAEKPPPRPHVVILVLDAVRADALSCYGAPKGATPHIDRLAEEGTLFEDVLSPGVWTLPSHASIFTGLSASEHGVGWGNLFLEDRFTTLAEHLQAAGYRTVAISCNTFLNNETNLFQGFSEIHQEGRWLFSFDLLGCMSVAEAIVRCPLEQWFPGAWGDYLTDRGALQANVLAERAFASSGQPLLLFINYIDGHLRYVPPRPYRRGWGRSAFKESYRLDQDYHSAIYPYMLRGEKTFTAKDLVLLRRLNQGAVSYLDSRVGEICAALEHHGLAKDTLLIVTSDHGDSLGEHGLLDHHFSVYQTLARVPLIVRFPGRLPAGRVKTPVQTTDVYPTVLAAAGLVAETNPRVARSLLGAAQGTSPRPRVCEYLESAYPMVAKYQYRHAPGGYRRFLCRYRAIELNGYKYIHSSGGDHELYYLPDDPGEENNLINAESERAAILRKCLDEWVASVNVYRPARRIGEGSDLSSETKERLRALGYL